MANINVKGFMILAVSLIVSIILVTGVLIPVIGNASSGGGESTYKNTGEYYYQTATDEEHTLGISSTDRL